MSNANRQIVLGMPSNGRMTAAASAGFWCACGNSARVFHDIRVGSLLCSNFNQLWCRALNFRHQGKRVDYFAMLHDDVGPLNEHWLDVLIDELEAKELDVLSVVVPIKDRRGMTSMALQHPTDDWLPFARLSMHDVYQLPETFTADDVGRPLLLNTGCWVAKWNQDWAKTVHFEIRDRIVFNAATNCYQAQTMPEDWDFSRQLNEIGKGDTSHLRPLRIGATRKIAVNHRGDQDFANHTGPWGSDKFDIESTPISPIANGFPYDIAGWLTPKEGAALANLSRGKRVLEIGSYCGLSTVCIARAAESVTAVDYFDGRETPNPRNTRQEFDAALARHGVTHKVTVCHPEAEIPLPAYDVAFIDGAHDAEAVRADISKAMAVLADGGLLAFHDYHDFDPGVAEAVNELLADGAELLSVTDTLAVVRPPAAIPLEV